MRGLFRGMLSRVQRACVTSIDAFFIVLMPAEKIEVIAYSGSRSEELPKSFILYGERIEVIGILDMWIEEEFKGMLRKRFFKVRGSDGYTHKIYCDEMTMEWFIQI